MTGPNEKPVIEEWLSQPSVGVKPVYMDERTADAFVASLIAKGSEAHTRPLGDGLFAVVIDKL